MGKKRRERVEQRRADRKEVKMARIEARTARVETRQETKQTAYEHGIDPNAAMWEGIASLGQSASSVAVSALSPAKNLTGTNKSPLEQALNQDQQPQQKKSSNMIIIAVVAVVLFIFMKKK